MYHCNQLLVLCMHCSQYLVSIIFQAFNFVHLTINNQGNVYFYRSLLCKYITDFFPYQLEISCFPQLSLHMLPACYKSINVFFLYMCSFFILFCLLHYIWNLNVSFDVQIVTCFYYSCHKAKKKYQSSINLGERPLTWPLTVQFMSMSAIT